MPAAPSGVHTYGASQNSTGETIRAHRLPVRSVLVAIVLSLILNAGLATAQYSTFGKNKIQYDDFDWEVLSSDHIDLYYYPDERELALIALEEAEKSFDFLSRKFSYVPKERIPMVVFASHQHFEQTKHTLYKTADLNKVPALIVVHGRVGDALKQVRSFLDVKQEIVR